jgi:pimeloyl-ACP methyl ester carboxylesterase
VVISAARPLAPPCAERVRVVLVHGAFGFGKEWDPVLARLERDHVDFVVYEWKGPWSGIGVRVDELAPVLQELVDDGGPRLRELVVIGHSAGGVIADYAARRLRVPPRLRVRVASIAAPDYLKVMPVPPLPPRVSVDEYLDGARDDAPVREPGERRILLGRVGHDRSLGRATAALIDSVKEL